MAKSRLESCTPQSAYLQAEVALRLGKYRAAERSLKRLAAQDGWDSHLEWTRARLSASRTQRWFRSGGSLLFAVALAFLFWLAGRGLLRPHLGSVLFALGALLLWTLASTVLQVVDIRFGLALAGASILVHAAFGTAHRFRPRGRGVWILGLGLWLGVFGSAVALVAGS